MFMRVVSLALSVVLPVAAQASQTREFRGEAYAPESGQLLYVEEHRVIGECRQGEWTPLRQEVNYRDPAGEIMATKELIFDAPYEVASLRFEDRRFKRKVSLGPVGAVDGEPVIVDAAFHPFLQRHWDALLAGNVKAFRFRASDFDDVIELRLSHKGVQVGGDGQKTYRFELSPEFWLARLFVTPIQLTYDARRELIRYEGVTNILAADDRYFRAQIRYQPGHSPDC